MVIGDVLAQPVPERLDRHQIGAVAGQRHEFDVQARGGGPHRLGTMIRRAIPDDGERTLGDFRAQPAQHIDRVFAIGARIGPEPHLAFIVEIQAVERDLG